MPTSLAAPALLKAATNFSPLAAARRMDSHPKTYDANCFLKKTIVPENSRVESATVSLYEALAPLVENEFLATG